MRNHIEKAISFGRHNHLIGIFTEPEKRRQDAPIVILLTAGLVNSAGPFRMYASIARRLARDGVATFRVDLSGVGESAIPATEIDIETRTLEDIEDAMDHLEQKFGVSDFIAGGLCSGADDAHLIACEDQRITGAILLDGYAYRSTSQRVKRFFVKAMSPARVLRWFGRLISPVSSRRKGAPSDDLGGYARSFPPVGEFADELATNVADGKKYLCIFSGGVSVYYDAHGQLLEGLNLTHLSSDISEVYYPKSDHTYALREHRNQLCSTVADWVAGLSRESVS